MRVDLPSPVRYQTRYRVTGGIRYFGIMFAEDGPGCNDRRVNELPDGPKLVRVRVGWAAVGPGWAVFGPTSDEALERYRDADRKHQEIRQRSDAAPNDERWSAGADPAPPRSRPNDAAEADHRVPRTGKQRHGQKSA